MPQRISAIHKVNTGFFIGCKACRKWPRPKKHSINASMIPIYFDYT